MPTKPSKKPVVVQERAPKLVDAKLVDAKAGDECGISKLTPEALSLMADFFKVLSEVSRLQIVCSLKAGAKNVTEIIEETGLGQANVSKHLKMLTQAGVVAREQRGVCVYYRIANPFLFELCDLVCDVLTMQVEQQSQQLQQLSRLRQNR
ncbi:MAG: winged helix-turn-helix transcriptional regulator [Synechococcales cyanobacterium M58_A2018_015]|nr:winged helix-turn-helix transcriptional regulator [Synechococcales cyanobacterium M58_A2018_015]